MTGFRRTTLSLLLLSITACFASPRAIPAADDWQPIDPADLALKDNPKAPGADAMILYRESTVDAQVSADVEYFRLKIFTQTGAKQADVDIPFVKGMDEIKDFRARTIQADGTIVNFEGKPFEKTIEKVSGFKYLAKTFTLPDVKPGCIIEYKYRDQYNPERYLNMEWTVQGELFTRLARFAVKPDKSWAAPQLFFRAHQLPPGTTPQRQSNGWYALEVRDLPGIDEEQYMPPEASLKARVEFYYHNQIEPSKETTEGYWKRIGKNWSDDLDQFVDKKKALATAAAGTISPNDPPETKLRKIYARVEQIRNLNTEESKTHREEKTENLKPNKNAEDVLNHGYGYESEISMLFVGLARAAGFDATELYVAPRSLRFFDPNMRDIHEITEELVWVRSGAKEYYLDPSAHFYPFGLLPWFESSARGIRLTKEGGVLISTPDLSSSESTVIRHADVTMDEAGSVNGKLQVDFTGEAGAVRRADYNDEDETGRRKALENEIKQYLPDGSSLEITSLSNWDNIEQPLHVEGNLKIPEIGTSTGRRMLLPIGLFRASQAKAFQSEKRVNPIYFHFPFEEIDDVILRLPAGFTAGEVPKPVALKPGPVSYDISAASTGGQIEVKRHLVMNGLFFDVKSYPAFRAFFNSVKTNDDAQVVLEKAQSAKNN